MQCKDRLMTCTMSKLTQWKNKSIDPAQLLLRSIPFSFGVKQKSEQKKIKILLCVHGFLHAIFKSALWFLCPWCIWRNEQWKHHVRNAYWVTYRKLRTKPSQYLKTDYPGVRTGMFPQLRCCDSSCLCKYALLRGLTPLHNSVPLLYREDTLTQRRKASERHVYFSGIPIFERSVLFSFLSSDFAEAMALEVCSWVWLAFSLHLKQSPQHPSVNSSSDEQALGPVLPDLSLLISIVLGQRFFGPALSVFSASLIQSRGLEVLSSRPRHAQPSADWAQRKRITLGHNDVMARAQVLPH